MPLLIGTDEAGYGPNLGPLVITATAWRLPDGALPEDLWRLLNDALTDSPSRGDSRLYVADSKKVYSAGKSLARLEESVLGFLRHLKISTGVVTSLCSQLSAERFAADYREVHRDTIDDLTLPVTVADDKCAQAAENIGAALSNSGVTLLSVQSRIIFPPEFNQGVAAVSSKGQILSAATLKLVRDAVDLSDEKSGWVYCDKHGGRNRYDEIVSDAFDDDFVFRLEESGPQSRYRCGSLEFCFRTKAEALLPVALASMVSKYVREIVMLQFNRFWQHHIPNLKATKGYPVDAIRFWEDIAEKASELGISKPEVWRCR